MQFGLLVVSLFLIAGCAGDSPAVAQPQVGMSQAEVAEAVGPPHSKQTFSMPDAPFFGPQEALTGVVEPGIEVTEWQYERDGQVLYVWFVAAAEGQTVVGLFEAPVGAVY